MKKSVNHLRRYVILTFENRSFSSYDGLREENRLRSASGFISIFLAFFFFWNIICFSAFAQEEGKGKKEDAESEIIEEEEKFTNYGLISISNKGELSKGRKHVSFNIINNAGRSISNMFGWVYYKGFTKTGEGDTEAKDSAGEKTTENVKKKEDLAGKEKGYILANYPNKGGVCDTGRFHKPGKKAKWRFILKRVVPVDIIPKFLLLVNMNSVFFAKVEVSEPTPPPPEEEGEEEKTKEGEVNPDKPSE